ncbi:tumor protein D54-like isoform X2 [Saccoglossus kowalevskii]|uniref:Tumor protein D54-like isoform X3 n=1 Tax=Saccoglossus kowalevskii TaxID=10224 RepID=A0ABM0MYB6_SACKO|nr:PREDICTED: tumor protein D54-like isoform X3 [Saccoglossus kowalevskii]
MDSKNNPPTYDKIYPGMSPTEPLYDAPTETQPLYDNTASPTSGSGDDTLYTDPELVHDEEEKEALRIELNKTEEEISTLKQVLHAKENRVGEIKRKLGLTPMNQFSKSVKQSWTSVQQSSAYQTTSSRLKEWNEKVTQSSAYTKTKTGLTSASQKTGAAFSSFGSAVSKKMGEIRGSNAFKSMEEKTSSFASTVKTVVTGQPSPTNQEGSSFEDALNSTAEEQHKQHDEADLVSPGTNTLSAEDKIPL